jgi:hypothetical protein
MKKLICLTLLTLITFVGIVCAADKMLYDSKSKPAVAIQNLGALAPVKEKLRCDTTAMTKSPFKGYTTAGFLGHELQVVDAAGAPVNVKWTLDGVLAWIGSTFSFTNPAGTTYSKAAFQPYSATSRSLTSCTKRQ